MHRHGRGLRTLHLEKWVTKLDLEDEYERLKHA